MREVTKEEFFATVGQMNVHPRPEKMKTYWETPERQLMGVSTPGYKCEDENGRHTTEKRYWVTEPEK